MHSARVRAVMNDDEIYESGSSGATRNDTGNDIYFSVIDVASGDVLVEPSKLFTRLGQSDEELRFGTSIEDDTVYDAAAELEGGRTYRLEIIGRSDGYALDLITVNDGSPLVDLEVLETPVTEPEPEPEPEPTPEPPAVPAPVENTQPVALNDRVEVDHNTSIVVDVLSNDSDADGDPLKVIDVSYGGDTAIVEIANGGIRVNPLSSATEERVETIVYTVSDGNGGSDTGILRVDVAAAVVEAPAEPEPEPAPLPDPEPVPEPTPIPEPETLTAKDDVATTDYNQQIFVDVLANDASAQGQSLKLTNVVYDGDTAIVSIRDGKVLVNPLRKETESRVEEIVYTVENAAGDTATATLRVQVNAIDDTPDPVDEIVGQSGQVTVNQLNADQWHSVSFDQPLDNPSVVMSPLSLNGGQAAHARVRNVTETGFEFQIEEWSYLDQIHDTETISWIAVEQGAHTLNDGSVVQAGASTLGQNSADFAFADAFVAAPIVLGQVASEKDATPVNDRVFDVTAEGFGAILQEEQALRQDGVGPTSEDFHWIAFEDGVHQSFATTYDFVNSDPTSVSLNGEVGDAVFAEIQTGQGGDTGSLRFVSQSGDQLQAFIQEEQSFDAELTHSFKEIGFVQVDEFLFS